MSGAGAEAGAGALAADSEVLALPHTDWLYHHLRVSGDPGEVAEPDFLWITRGQAIGNRAAAMERLRAYAAEARRDEDRVCLQSLAQDAIACAALLRNMVGLAPTGTAMSKTPYKTASLLCGDPDDPARSTLRHAFRGKAADGHQDASGIDGHSE